MNIKKIKLDLTVNFLNLGTNSNVLQAVKESMSNFREDVGNFLDATVSKDAGIEQDIVKRTYAMRYENCTLDVDLVVNSKTSNQYLNGFRLN